MSLASGCGGEVVHGDEPDISGCPEVGGGVEPGSGASQGMADALRGGRSRGGGGSGEVDFGACDGLAGQARDATVLAGAEGGG